MLTISLPKPLQDEFERRARLLYSGDSITLALAEAIELWMAQHRHELLRAERAANNRAFAEMRAQVEREYAGKWVVIAHGSLQGVGDSITQIEELASTALDRLIFQVGSPRRKEVEFGWQMTFA